MALNIQTEEINSVQRRVRVEISAEEMTEAFAKAYGAVRQAARIKGFRPGKAPLDLVRRFYGAEATERVFDILGRKLLDEIARLNLPMAGQPHLEEVKEVPQEGRAYAISAIVDLIPKIEPQGYDSIPLQMGQPVPVTDEEVKKRLELMALRMASTRPITDPAATVAVGMKVTLSKGELRAEGHHHEEPDVDLTGQSIHIGRPDHLPGLGDQLVGMTAGSRKDIEIKLPEDHDNDHLAGAVLKGWAEVGELFDVTVPPVDDALAKDLEFESLDLMAAGVREDMEAYRREEHRKAVEKAAVDALLERNPFEVPPIWVDRTIDQFLHSTFDPKLVESVISNVKVRENFLPHATRQVRTYLLVDAIAQKEGITASDEELAEALQEMARARRGRGDGQGDLRANARAAVIHQKAYDLICSRAVLVG